MAHITIEYVIMLPILIMQVILFPLTASWLMNVWVDSRRNLALEEVASHLGSTIQQVYYMLDHETVLTGTFRQRPDVPMFIENYHYTANATLKQVAGDSSARILEITLRLVGVGKTASAKVVLGQNAEWEESTFVSNSTNACIIANKTGEIIKLRFGG